MSDRYDIAIIGTGAGGGTLLHALAPTGKRILVLERGDYVPREKDNWSTKAVNLDGKYNTKEVWYDRDGKALHPHTNYCAPAARGSRGDRTRPARALRCVQDGRSGPRQPSPARMGPSRPDAPAL
jgi:choline dehydrogenase-like flavoprotein